MSRSPQKRSGGEDFAAMIVVYAVIWLFSLLLAVVFPPILLVPVALTAIRIVHCCRETRLHFAAKRAVKETVKERQFDELVKAVKGW